jgi:hypothetical protein
VDDIASCRTSEISTGGSGGGGAVTVVEVSAGAVASSCGAAGAVGSVGATGLDGAAHGSALNVAAPPVTAGTVAEDDVPALVGSL